MGAPEIRYANRAADSGFCFLGVIGVIIGASAAIAIVPVNPQPAGALFWPAAVLACGLLIAPLLSVRGGTRVILRAEHMLMVGLIYWLLLDLFQGAYPLDDVDYDHVVMAFLAIGTLAVGIWLGVAGRGWNPPGFLARTAERSIDPDALIKLVLISFFLGIFYFAYCSGFDPLVMFDGLGAGRYSAPWSRGEFGGSLAFVEHLKYFGYVLPSLTVMIANKKGWNNLHFLVSVILTLIMLLFLSQGGGRRIVGMVVGAAIITWLLQHGRVNARLLFGGILATVVLLTTMEEILKYRNQGFASWVNADEPQTSEIFLHVDDNFLRLSQVTMLFPDVQGYVGFQPIYYALVLPVPRVLWPEKPTNGGYDLTEMLGRKGVSLTQSIVGELYASYGVIAVFLGGLVLGRVANIWNKILSRPGGDAKPLLYGLGVMGLFCGLRSMQDLVLMSYALLAWFLVSRLVKSGRAVVPYFRRQASLLKKEA